MASYRTPSENKYELVVFKQKINDIEHRIHTIRHRRANCYFPYVVMRQDVITGAWIVSESMDRDIGNASFCYPANVTFSSNSVYLPKEMKFTYDWNVSQPVSRTTVDMAIYILSRESKEVLDAIIEKASVRRIPIFADYPTRHMFEKEYKWRLEDGWYDRVPKSWYEDFEARCVYMAQKGFDPWTNNKNSIIKGNLNPAWLPTTPVYGSMGSTTTKSQSATSQGGSEPMTQRPETTTIDNALIRELKDAIKSISHKPTALEERLLEAVIEKTKDLATAEIEKELQGRLVDFIDRTYGSLPTRLEIKVAGKQSTTMTGIFHEKLPDILTMLANNIPVMLTGPAGSGKNYSLEQAAKAMEIEFYYTGAITQEYKLTGFIDAGGRYHETEFYKAFKNGGLFMLDEVDASSPETLVILNGAIANRYFDFPNGRIHAHDDFRIACAGNTYGTGADMVYVGRNVLDGATLDRFAVIKMDYDTAVEKQLCPDQEFFDFIQAVRKGVFKTKLRHIVGMRASINGYRSLVAGMSKQFILESIVLKGLSVDDLNILVGSLEDDVKATNWGRELGKFQSAMKKAVR